MDDRSFLTERRVELYAAALLAVATVATAWCGYQSSRWSGEQSIAFSRANAARVESTRATSTGLAQRQIDVALFTQFVDAFARGEDELAEFYERRFRDEFEPAFEAWVATSPRTNPDAPLSPFALPEYRLAADREAAELAEQAEEQSALALRNNQRSDNYVLTVVLFASVLFFAGISSKFASRDPQLLLLAIGTLVLIGTAIWVATFPVSVAL